MHQHCRWSFHWEIFQWISEKIYVSSNFFYMYWVLLWYNLQKNDLTFYNYIYLHENYFFAKYFCEYFVNFCNTFLVEIFLSKIHEKLGNFYDIQWNLPWILIFWEIFSRIFVIFLHVCCQFLQEPVQISEHNHSKRSRISTSYIFMDFHESFVKISDILRISLNRSKISKCAVFRKAHFLQLQDIV